jgi:N-methylhydantoinase A/oxoprolinase/acetone carboxylase beta subunit/N-methylhydantoinase B/oxoprolinase/acetone carboxylase alpha subunit
MGRYRVTVDTGGTFSDFVVLDEEDRSYSIYKVPSTPDDPSRAILEGLELLSRRGVEAADIGFFCHGTTVATNALLEERGARTGLIVTDGFRAIYETMEQSRPFGPALFDLRYRKPSLLAPGRATAEVRERVGADGDVRIPLDQDSVAEAIARLEAEDVESVAICLLFGFMNDRHEREVADAVRRAHPEWRVTAASELLPQIREYYRLSTTVINAYVSPVLGTYVHRLERELDRLRVAPGQRFTMQSNGGSAPLGFTPERAVGTILSGPAGGVTAGLALAKAAGVGGDVITFDMGGTSCDVALIHNGEPVITGRGTVERRHIALPMLDINTVSAGGGTIARVDGQGVLHVGPASAGAVPGPACYSRGGSDATVTDADVVLGYLNPSSLLGGEMQVDAAAAREAVRRAVADPLGVDVLRAADGIAGVVNVKMGEAIKAISTERGFDLRDFTLVAFGGAGPVHACQIALDMGIPRVLIPRVPGAASALGLLLSDVKHDYLRSKLCDLERLDVTEANGTLTELSARATSQLEGEGFAAGRIRLRYFMDMRYAGQGYENPVPLDSVPLTRDDLRRYRDRFDAIHKDCHGHAAPGQPVEVVNYRVEAIGLVPQVGLARIEAGDSDAGRARTGERLALFSSVAPGPVPVPVYVRELLRAGDVLPGPAIIEQYDATTVICPGQHVEVDDYGNLLVTAAAQPGAAPVTRTAAAAGADDGDRVDAIDVEVVSQSLAGVAEEMQNSLFCTGYSTIIRESRDASCAIMDAQGRVIAQHTVLPLHLGAFPACVEGLLRSRALDEMQDGDSFVINHPYEGGSPHATDVAVISPIFADGELLGFSGSIAHKTDIGGLVPGTNSGQAREIFHEGLLLPAVPLYRAGVPVKEVEAIIRANSRTPELVIGDLRGQAGATLVGVQRVVSLCRKYGTAKVVAATRRLFTLTEQQVRSAVIAWPDGVYEGETWLHDDGMEGGRPVRVHVVVTIAGDSISFDFRGCADQASGPYNIRPPLVRAVCYYALKCLIGAELPANAGLAAAVGTTFRDHSLLCPDAPAPVNTYMPVAVATAEALFDALGKAVSAARMAESSGGTNGTISHQPTERGSLRVQYELPAGAIGARAHGDGVSASKAHVANGSAMPIEIIETEFPVEVERFELIPDSGGAGRYRGGLAYVRQYRMIADAVFATRGGKRLRPAAGREEGKPGRLSRILVNPGTPSERQLTGADGNVRLSAGDVLRIEQPGAGGYGNPHHRPAPDVLSDVQDGYVTPDAARADYGVAMRRDERGRWMLDEAATAGLRGGGRS